VPRLRPRGAAAVAAAVAVLALAVGPEATAASKRKRRRRRPEPTAVPRPPDPNRVTIRTADGVALAASWRPLPERPGAPAVLLVHDFSRDRRDWNGLEGAFAARGFATLAIDLRAHGESTKRNGAVLGISPRQMSDPSGFPRDVEAACAWLRPKAPKVGVVGLSLGGLLAVLATARGWADAAVVISSNADRLEPLAGGKPAAARATLFVASEKAPRRAASAKALFDAAAAPKKLLVVPGSAHNLVLFSEHPEVTAAMLDWLSAQLGAVPLPAAGTAPAAPTPTPAPTATPTPTPKS
jgi:alpha-beta hydrolase superfamily lysophospholipase